MHLGLTARQRALMAAVHHFLAEWLPVPADDSEYFAALCDRGWSAPGWPMPWGGGLGAAETFLVESALAQAGAPMLGPGTLHHVGPLLMALEDEAICQRYLPAMASGRISWAQHGSLSGAAPLTGRFRAGGVELDSPRTLVYGARDADAVALLVEERAEIALAVADLAEVAVQANQPLDPDTVCLEALRFDVLATTRTHPTLAPALAVQSGSSQALECERYRCWTPRLRYLFDRLVEEDPDPVAHSEIPSLAVAVSGLEAMEQRAAFNADDGLREAVAIRCVELGRTLAALWMDRLGYYALPAPDPTRQHNELPEQAFAAQDAIAELIRYLEGDFGTRRDSLARNLGIASRAEASD